MCLDKKDYYVQLPKEYFKKWINEGDYYTPAIYAYLFRDYTISKNIKFTKHEVKEYFQVVSNDSRKIKIINNALDNLVEGCSSYGNNETIRIRCLRPSDENKSYIKICDCEMDRIFTASITENKYKLFAIYAYLKSAINFNKYSDEYGYCYRKIDTIVERTGLAKATVENGIKVLKDVGVIVYGNSGLCTKKGLIKTDSNVYMMNYEGNMEKLSEIVGMRNEELKHEGWSVKDY